ncbi:ImmA/IrrE family metallo-endopeptidase [Listeria monocytogenes]|uniref:ImmA/IrrE family metallo-endopeptidase n=1 Tax=Listeria TaxID=1637 RepID=UPI00061DCA09|nr:MULTISPECIES: ImmA/IrrE family metallo-endopeptidase [Listeria]EAC2431421.1 ImmA/IrrE family metallo-endopeptidase [Listeria monocytogenes]EAC6733252.1 ImmA/IrrE family metallo-endopeptidase [Listeria monocytogenes]EAD6458291.1 ImmA/IrrE family metallo-endopeptidase [Listeria monocytogenes]EAD6470473.1 ImmA/IrrE family metallo-endopeptidase [Listeria monocytogenes]EAD6595122.1 ImmA/IrrE family metallo-endopeptidase [Listeria monocytogenes]
MNILDVYQPSAAEKYLSDYLITKNILTPSDLEIESMLIKLNLFIVKGDFSMSLADYGGIVLARQLSREQSIEKIHHELVHVIAHCGNQQMMDAKTVEQQEKSANRNLMYISIPFHMLNYIDFTSDCIEQDLLELFPTTTGGIINNRMLSIRNYLLQSSALKQYG